MIPDIGYVILLFSLLLSLFQFGYLFSSRLQSSRKFFELFRFNNTSLFYLILSSFAILVYLHVISDFSVMNVYLNSHTLKPFIYKISGVWGNHEGSVLLFTTLLAGYNFFFGISGRFDSTKLQVLSVQSLILACFLAFTLFTSNPFERLFPVPKNGIGLNPVLQDVALAIHPPILYLGYTGFSLVLSIAVVTLIRRDFNKDMLRNLKQWSMLAWSFLTLGIAMGSWWAYRELGWGGFWFWDPVENSSLMPWLSATALFHSTIVAEKRGALRSWVIFLAILTFSLSLLGFFLVRSGVLNSVHSFANDPLRGIFVLLIIAIISGSSFLLYSLRSGFIKTGQSFALISREGSIMFNNLFVITLLFIVMLGTLYPLFLQIISENSVSVGSPYYNLTFVPIALIALVLAGVGPLLKWKHDGILKNYKKYIFADLLSITAAAVVFIINGYKFSFALFGIYCSVWLVTSCLSDFYRKINNNFSIGELRKLPLPYNALFMAHTGVAVLVLGISIVSGWQQEEQLAMKKADKIDIAGYHIEFEGVDFITGKNYLARKGSFMINNKKILHPEVRFYPVENQQTTEASIFHNVFSNLYVVIGSAAGKDSFAVRIYYRPGVNLIWLGGIMIAMGGFLSFIAAKSKIHENN